MANVTRTLVYVEGDASLRTYDDSEGKRHSALNILQSKSYPHIETQKILISA